MIDRWQALVDRLEGVGQWLAPLGLRLLLAWLAWTAGRGVHEGLLLPAWPSGALGTWVLTLALLMGLGTRLAALVVLVLAALAAAPWQWTAAGAGAAVASAGDGFAPAPLLVLGVLVLALPLLLRGGGKLSLDALLAWRLGSGAPQPWADFYAWGMVLLLLGVPCALLLPIAGAATIAAGVALLLLGRWLRT